MNGGRRRLGMIRKGGRCRCCSSFRIEMDNFKWGRIAGGALFVDNFDVQLLASLAMLPDARIIKVFPCLCEVDNRWSIVEHVNYMLLATCVEIFLGNYYQVVRPWPVWKNCNFLASNQLSFYVRTRNSLIRKTSRVIRYCSLIYAIYRLTLAKTIPTFNLEDYPVAIEDRGLPKSSTLSSFKQYKIPNGSIVRQLVNLFKSRILEVSQIMVIYSCRGATITRRFYN